jgi:hypothetical protein
MACGVIGPDGGEDGETAAVGRGGAGAVLAFQSTASLARDQMPSMVLTPPAVSSQSGTPVSLLTAAMNCAVMSLNSISYRSRVNWAGGGPEHAANRLPLDSPPPPARPQKAHHPVDGGNAPANVQPDSDPEGQGGTNLLCR